jgi:glycosyltransferase involved in cell wall biosynthesis
LQSGDYVCAVGGNARDYTTLGAVAERHPEIPQVWVVRPGNLTGLHLPPNVRVAANISYPASMNFLAHSRFMVLPLKSAEAPCGHVTLVSAMYLGKAIVATCSAGITDYVTEGETGLLCAAANVDSLEEHMLRLWNDPGEAERLGGNGLAFVQNHCSDAAVAEEMVDYFRSLGLA